MFVATLIIALLAIFYFWYPPFGGRSYRSHFAGSPNYNKNKFINATPTRLSFGIGGILSLIRRQLGAHPNRRPRASLQLQKPDLKALRTSSKPHIVWLGHSTFIIWTGSKTILLDPMFGKRPSPFWGLGPARFSGAPQLRIADLPPVDAVVISHDHYDHLDYGSIRQLRTKTKHFFAPLGVGAHLRKWGVASKDISELDWWDTETFDGITFACTPARHFSGRSLTDRYATLWASWVISFGQTTIFFSGDGGYGPHFKEIGRKYGPFDLALLECGQYDVLWPYIHMMPEQTIQAHRDLRGKVMMPIHWGAFVLALHDWTNPIERVLAAAKQTGQKVSTPHIGEVVPIATAEHITEQWWEAYRKVKP